jgi:predicted DNA-binding antitoxin AbrB/MazE fold protein
MRIFSLRYDFAARSSQPGPARLQGSALLAYCYLPEHVLANMLSGGCTVHERIEVVYEKGVLRPLGAVPRGLHEHQQLTVLIETSERGADWLAAADAGARLEDVRRALAKAPGTLAQMVHDEREER